MADVKGAFLTDRKVQWALGVDNILPDLSLHLFVNNLSFMDCETTPLDLTECTAPGYAAYTFNPVDWTGGVSSCVSLWTHPTIIFNFTGPGTPGQTIYGHWVQDDVTAEFWWGQLYATPIVLPMGAYALNVAPTFTDF